MCLVERPMKFEEPAYTEPWVDPLVAEVRTARETLLADAGYDLHVLCERLREKQVTAGRKIVRREPRRVTQTSNAA